MTKAREIWHVTGSNTNLILTTAVDCPKCDAKAGEPCKIQMGVQEVMQSHIHPSEAYHLGNDKTYFPDGERVHVGRFLEEKIS